MKLIEVSFIEGEVWKEIKDSNGIYFISDHGRIKSVRHIHPQWHYPIKEERLIALSNNGGYMQTKLILKGKRVPCKVHRLVAQAFIPNPENKPTVNHIDNNPTNNHLCNLEWATRQEQSNHSKKQGRNRHGENHALFRFGKDVADEIGDRYRAGGFTQAQLAKEYGISEGYISKVINKITPHYQKRSCE